jgi:hypothetical protein
MADDEARGVVVLFGGNPGPVYDTWEWDGTTWAFRAVVGPPLRPRLNMVYDRARSRVVLHGVNTVTNAPETWEWDGTLWTQRVTTAVPGPSLIAFDPLRNVAVHYDGGTWEYGPVYPAGVTPFGAGCAGSVGVPSLAATTLPWLGDFLEFETTNLAPSSALASLVIGFSDRAWAGVPLPYSLRSVGMPGCDLWTSAELSGVMGLAGGTARLRLPIPNQPGLLGLEFFQQSVVAEPGANRAGLIMSNATRSVVGGR